ncbi:MAG: imidazole glycerol phosphate synthase subunit HisH [Desulfovibrionales bacterium]
MLAIVDYKAGNLTSVKRALDFLDIPCRITARSQDFDDAYGIIFPGVGAAGSAMRTLIDRRLDAILREQVSQGKPLLGICLGCQIVLDYSPENDTSTLGLVAGKCLKFDPDLVEEDGRPINIPHMGWNSLTMKREFSLLEGVEEDAEFYFVHSYFPDPEPEYVIATTYYGREFCSVLGREGLWATQFHPEKSGRPGLTLLRNFHAYCREKS